jgi:hypothetical protein
MGRDVVAWASKPVERLHGLEAHATALDAQLA